MREYSVRSRNMTDHDRYWSVNYVRVFQLLDPANNITGPTYVASEQPANTATNAYTAANAVATPNLNADRLCPRYNFSIISDGKYQYAEHGLPDSRMKLILAGMRLLVILILLVQILSVNHTMGFRPILWPTVSKAVPI